MHWLCSSLWPFQLVFYPSSWVNVRKHLSDLLIGKGWKKIKKKLWKCPLKGNNFSLLVYCFFEERWTIDDLKRWKLISSFPLDIFPVEAYRLRFPTFIFWHCCDVWSGSGFIFVNIWEYEREVILTAGNTLTQTTQLLHK